MVWYISQVSEKYLGLSHSMIYISPSAVRPSFIAAISSSYGFVNFGFKILLILFAGGACTDNVLSSFHPFIPGIRVTINGGVSDWFLAQSDCGYCH